jgi:uncharacterized membrane protein SirB2
MLYLALKHLHMTSAGVSIALFLLRGVWMFADSPRLQSKFARIVPHVVDTILLASALGLMLVIRQYPFVNGKAVRGLAFVAAIAVFAWIVMTARMHWPWLLPV